jgi:hypothetical protein
MANGESARNLYSHTMRRIQTISRSTGAPVEIMWECKLDELLNEDPELKRRFDNIQIVEPLHPRLDALRGGRVSVTITMFFILFYRWNLSTYSTNVRMTKKFFILIL